MAAAPIPGDKITSAGYSGVSTGPFTVPEQNTGSNAIQYQYFQFPGGVNITGGSIQSGASGSFIPNGNGAGTGEFHFNPAVPPGASFSVLLNTDKAVPCGDLLGGGFTSGGDPSTYTLFSFPYNGSCGGVPPPCSDFHVTAPPKATLTEYQAYGGKVTATGGKPPYTYRLVTGLTAGGEASAPLPAGMTLNSSTGEISGTPTETTGRSLHGIARIFIEAADANGCKGVVLFELVVRPVPVILGGGYYEPRTKVGSIAISCPQLSTSCIYLFDVVYPSASGQTLSSAGSLGTIGRASGKVRAGKKGRLLLTLTQKGVRLLQKKHALQVTLKGTRKQARRRTDVQGRLTLRLLGHR